MTSLSPNLPETLQQFASAPGCDAPRAERNRGPFSWTDESRAELARLWDAGDSARKIAEAMGCSHNAVISKVARMGLTPRFSPIVSGKPAKALWTDEQREQVQALWAEGLTCRQIGERVGRSRDAILRVTQRFGLTPRPVAPKPKCEKPIIPKSIAREPVPALPVLHTATAEYGSLDSTHCQWPVNNGRPWVFCAEKACGGRYCAGHAAMARIGRREAACAS